MKPLVTSFRLWLLITLICAGAVGFVGARLAIGHIQGSQELAGDRAKDGEIARAIAAQVTEGGATLTLRAIQSVLPNDQIIVFRGDRVVFAGPPVVGGDLEVEAVEPFPGGRVVLRDYHSPVPGVSLALSLVVGAAILLVVGVVLIATWWLTRAIQRPIARAVAAADRVAAGDFSARIGAVNPGEFGRLAKAFDSMAARLDAIDRDQRQFLADVTHEIVTPVNAIWGLAGAIADGTLADDGQRAEAADLIETHTQRLTSLLEDLRRLTHLDLAESVRWEDVDVARLCRSVLARFGRAAARARVKLSAQTEHHLVTADPRLLETILDNLVSNAIRYTPEGGTVQIRASQSSDALVLAVADTGIGIAHHELERIFDRFYRTDPGRDRVTGGSGLGLALARRSAQALEARIEVSSEIGRGSEFRLVLPTRQLPSRRGKASPAAARR